MAIVLTGYYKPKPGGLCKRLLRAIQALLDDNHVVHYLSVSAFPIHNDNCHFHRFPWPQNKAEGTLFWIAFHCLAPLFFLYIGYRYRISHVFAFGTTYSFVLQPLRLLKRIPLTLFLRADSLQNHKIKAYHPLVIKIEFFVEGLAIQGVRLYGASEALTKAVASRHVFFVPSLVDTLPNDIPEVEVNKATRRSGCVRLGSVGILEKRKNQMFILRCVQKLDPMGVHLYVYGVGPDENILRQQVDYLGIQDRVTFMGWVDPIEIWANIDLLLLPSLHEGAPNAILEAIAYGIPVLASAIPEHQEILFDENLLPLDEQVWINRLDLALRNRKQTFERLLMLQESVANRFRFDWEKELCSRILG